MGDTRYQTIPSGTACKAHKLADLLETAQYKYDALAAVSLINLNRGNYLQMFKKEGIKDGLVSDSDWGAGIEMCDGSYLSVMWANGFLTTRWSLLKKLQKGEGIADEQQQQNQPLSVSPRNSNV